MDAQDLISAYLDDALDARQTALLGQWLAADDAHLAQFTEALKFEQLIRDAVQTKETRAGAAPFLELQDTPRPAKRWPWLALAACLVATGALAMRWLRPPTPALASPVDWIAVVTKLRGAISAGETDLQTNQRLLPGRVNIATGALEITLVNGVRLVVEAPGEVELLTPMHVILRSGQAVVRVPEAAKGFRLETAGAQVVDLGTEFGVKCGPSGATDVLVFEGEVVASSATEGAGFPHHLTTGMATRFSPGHPQPAEIAYHPERFVRAFPKDQGLESKDDHFTFNAPTIESVVVFPRTQAISIDGDLSDWSVEGQFRCTHSTSRSMAGRMRYDAEHLYVAAQFGDPFPMCNVVDPAADGESGWRGGGLQIRLAAAPEMGWPANANAADYYELRHLTVDAAQVAAARNPAIAHLTLWHYAPAAQACLHIAYGMDFHGAVVNPPGFQAAFLKDADGSGYTLEYAIPWKLLNVSQAPRPGSAIAISWTGHWSDESGRLWKSQWVDIRNSSEPFRIHTWERAATWGRAIFH